MNEITTPTPTSPASPAPSAIEAALVRGDLSRLTEEQRTQYYLRVCESLGVNPLTRPFEYITLNGKLTLYATRAATDQLRALRGVSVEIVSREERDGLYVVHARARDREGRVDEAIGVVSLTDSRGQRLAGDALANALMKAETKAKRRVTLSICGLGWLDETEVDSVPDARPVVQAQQQRELPSAGANTSLRERLAQIMRERRDSVPDALLAKAREAWRSGDERAIAEVIAEIEEGNNEQHGA